MSETKNTHENKIERYLSEDASEELRRALDNLFGQYYYVGTHDMPDDYRFLRNALVLLIGSHKEAPDKQIHISPDDERLLRDTLISLRKSFIDEPDKQGDFYNFYKLALNYIRAAENTEELAYKGEFVSLLSKVRNELIHERSTDVDKKIRSFVNDRSMAEEPTTIHFRIIEEPLTPQNLALAFTTLTELATKLWLVAKRRLPDLIEYTQTRDIRFANEAGSTIIMALGI